MSYATVEKLEEGLEHIRRSPTTVGTLDLIVRRPAVDDREILDAGYLDLDVGLRGDTWSERGSSSTTDGLADPRAQLTVINSRLAALIAGPEERWALAGDQLYVDLDLSELQLPAGSRLSIGGAVVEVTAKPHLGCAKFAARFGQDALTFVNIGAGRDLNLRGRNARVVEPGPIRRSDPVRRA